MKNKTCKWHECGAEFSPDHPRQEFCSAAHRQARARWLRVRGARLVDPLLDGDMKSLMRMKRELEDETKGTAK